MKSYIVLVLGIFLSSTISCKKYLDEKSDATQIVPTSLADVQSLLDNTTLMNNNTPSFGLASCDDFFITDVTYNSRTAFNKSVYKWIPYDYRFTNDYANAYRPVYITNLCMERLDLLPADIKAKQQWRELYGACLFYRSYYYLELCWVFCKAYDATTSTTDKGIVLRATSDFNVPSVRSSVQESYEKIIADTKQGMGLLPDQVNFPTRPCKAAAYGLLARTYLSMRQYDSAGRYAQLALDLNNALMDYNSAANVSPNASLPFKQFNKETVFFSTASRVIPLAHPTSGGLVDSVLFGLYQTGDVRRTAFFSVSGNYRRFKGTYSDNSSALFSGIATDELWLIKAETLARKGAVTDAMLALNYLLQHRYTTAAFVPLVASSQSQALAFILTERRKELINRGSLRWMDIKRLNKEGAQLILQRKVLGEIFSLSPNDNRYALPLPTDIVEMGIPQNDY